MLDLGPDPDQVAKPTPRSPSLTEPSSPRLTVHQPAHHQPPATVMPEPILLTLSLIGPTTLLPTDLQLLLQAQLPTATVVMLEPTLLIRSLTGRTTPLPTHLPLLLLARPPTATAAVEVTVVVTLARTQLTLSLIDPITPLPTQHRAQPLPLMDPTSGDQSVEVELKAAEPVHPSAREPIPHTLSQIGQTTPQPTVLLPSRPPPQPRQHRQTMLELASHLHTRLLKLPPPLLPQHLRTVRSPTTLDP